MSQYTTLVQSFAQQDAEDKAFCRELYVEITRVGTKTFNSTFLELLESSDYIVDPSHMFTDNTAVMNEYNQTVREVQLRLYEKYISSSDPYVLADNISRLQEDDVPQEDLLYVSKNK